MRPSPAARAAGAGWADVWPTFEVAIDANDPARLRPFWLTALNYVEYRTDEGAVDLVDPAGRGPTIWFQQVPEGKFREPRHARPLRWPPRFMENDLGTVW